MPEKINIHMSYGEKLISLFARLLFTGESYSLTELSRSMKCSKATIIRLVDDIKKAYGVNIEETMKGNRKYYRLDKIGKAAPILPLTESEATALHMCKIFTEHLLGGAFYNEATRGLDKTLSLTAKTGETPSRHFASFHMGHIDYTPHQEKIRILIDAMKAGKVCRITYQAIMQKKAKTYHVKPLKIFSHRDTMYLHARLAKEPGKRYREPDYDPLLAIHRFKKVEMTDIGYIYPEDYRFEDVFNRNFGVMKHGAFTADVEFTGWAANYVAERIWSEDQTIEKIGDDRIRLTLTVSSDTELIAWVLSFGEEARITGPEWLVEIVAEKASRVASLYGK
jgi:predicted DNA-binding transcriptional regulator YafY